MKIATRERTVVQEYKVFIADDGKEFTTEDACEDYEKRKNGDRMTCPACNGKGYHQGRWVDAYDNYDIGHVEGHYEHERCTKCGGKGYLEKITEWK